jgi:hypothetical protein
MNPEQQVGMLTRLERELADAHAKSESVPGFIGRLSHDVGRLRDLLSLEGSPGDLVNVEGFIVDS